ncbi:MAG: hypothetical protein H6920_01375 [Sphingomonadaceae bacterium]|nr:hypothetical protein [Sphingomonadaceae bacterium]MCB2085143.1 hypothetical protein [Sphingomonadaceae bacterium]MCP5390266.1 hypothetical protein [Sphingomonadaceae bacterium]MCP5392402.1 hypothetical protein [Sphingomonadaceae bacterium]
MKFAPITFAVAAAAMLSAPSLHADDDAGEQASEGEAKLAKMLEGRVAGEPQSCIYMRPGVDLTIIDGTALVYKSGKTLYVNIPRNADDIDDRDTLVTRRSSSRLCRTDIVTTQDSSIGMYTGNIFLGDFVPYRKVKS